MNHVDKDVAPTPTVSIHPRWLESKKQWPERLENDLRQLMLERKFFVFYRTKDDSIDSFHLITQRLQQHFDSDLWQQDAEKYQELLQQKIITKINRLRSVLLGEGIITQQNGSYYIVADRDIQQDDTLLRVGDLIQSFNDAEKRFALQLLTGLLPQETVETIFARNILERYKVQQPWSG